MELASVLCPAPRRGLFRLWGALLNELHASVFEPAEVHVAQARLTWWADALAQPRATPASHPLLRALREHAELERIEAADWRQLGLAALAFASGEDTASDIDALCATQRPFATAIAGVEATLFGGVPAVDSVVRHQLLRQARLALSERMRRPFWPLNLRARHAPAADHAAMAADLAHALLDDARLTPAAPLYRRSSDVLDRRAWRSIAARGAGAPPAPGLRLVVPLWRAARGA
jgi:hypothetical protein